MDEPQPLSHAAPAPAPARPPSPPPAPSVHVVNQGAGFGRLVGAFVTSIVALTAVFAVGLVAGLVMIGIISIIGMKGVWAGGAALDDFILEHSYREGGSREIAILPVEGVIDGNRAAFVRSCVDRILADSAVKGVVLRVNSPGGGVTASDEIWYEIERLKDAGLPVVASFGAMAASGGYYVACASDHITAQETCITGSIGVIAQVMTLEGLLDKVGIEAVTVVASRSPAKDVANDTMRSWTDDDRTQIRMMLDAAYETFHTRVADGRADAIPDRAELDTVADGSVFTAQDALGRGLIDTVGYLDDAIAESEKRAGIATGAATVVRFSQRPSLFGGLPFARSRVPPGDLLDAERVRTLVNDLGSVRVMYLMH